MLPGPALAPLAEAGRLDARVKTIAGALARARAAGGRCARWPGDAALIDVASFGETGLVASRRAGDGLPAPIPCGRVSAPRGAAGAVTRGRNRAHARAARWRCAAPWCRQRLSRPAPSAGGAPDGFIDTGFTCRARRRRP